MFGNKCVKHTFEHEDERRTTYDFVDTWHWSATFLFVRIFHLRKKEKMKKKEEDKLLTADFQYTAYTQHTVYTVYTSKSTGMKTEKNLFGEQKNTCCYTLREHRRTIYVYLSLSVYRYIHALIHKNIMVIIYEHREAMNFEFLFEFKCSLSLNGSRAQKAIHTIMAHRKIQRKYV